MIFAYMAIIGGFWAICATLAWLLDKLLDK